ncbi:MAG: M6 family metalloprotease domain-containing protein [Clostridia bacterium]|nr:M6 family metalloprotease domain-containing protein [Clostridia bacterium]
MKNIKQTKKIIILLAMLLFVFSLASCSIFENLISDNSLSTQQFDSYSSIKKDSKASQLTSDNITNVVILICFKDENPTNVFSDSKITNVVNNFNSNTGSSLHNYYYEMSYHNFSVNSIFPIQNSSIFIYQDQYNREYYLKNKSESGTKRYDAESILLNRAINAASPFLNTTNLNLDTNEDGYLDSLSFVVSGRSYSDNWGQIMWPHAFVLDTISGLSTQRTRSSQIDSLYAENYIFTFADDESAISLTCHEFGHLLGLPDYYHTEYDKEYLPVSVWDIMHSNQTPPQRFLTYTSYKYLGFTSIDMITEITKSGSYSLIPTSLSEYGDTVCYKITLNEKETIYIEYRNKDASDSPYDSSLPSSGLIVYRTNSSVSGNEKGHHNSANYPDEVFVYRRSVSSSSVGYNNWLAENSTTYSTRSLQTYELQHAALTLAEDEDNYSQLGIMVGSNSKKYYSNAIYLSNGNNTGITINVTSESDENITFSINLGDYDSGAIKNTRILGSTIDDEQLTNAEEIYYHQDLNISFEILYKNRSAYVTIPKTSYTINYNPDLLGTQTASLIYTDDENNTYYYDFELTIHDYPIDETEIITDLNKKIYKPNEPLDLTGLSFRIKYASGATIPITYSNPYKNDYSVLEGIDMGRIGIYNPIILYKSSIKIRLTNIKIVSDIIYIYVNEMNSNHIITNSNSYKFNVYGEYSNGEKMLLDDSEYNITINSTTKNKSNITISLATDENIFCGSYYYNMGTQTIKNITAYSNDSPISITANTKYGQAPIFDSSIVFSLKFSNDEVIENIPLNNYYDLLIAQFVSTKVGNQTLIANIEDASVSSVVCVYPKDDSVLLSQDKNAVVVNVGNGFNGYVKLYEEMNLVYLDSYLSSYLKIQYIDDEGNVISPLTHPSRVIKSNYYVYITTNNQNVLKLPIFIEGDLNGDGIINDYANLLNIYFGINILNPYEDLSLTTIVDVNSDGKFMLDDFVSIYNKYYYVKEEE